MLYHFGKQTQTGNNTISSFILGSSKLFHHMLHFQVASDMGCSPQRLH